jgi:phospholipase/carboxylesterase
VGIIRLLLGGLLLGAILAGCGGPSTDVNRGSARLTARPATPTSAVTPGLIPLQLGVGRDGSLLVPASYNPAQPMPLVLALHGAGGNANGPLSLLSSYAEQHGFLLLAVDSRDVTWDAIHSGAYGPDVAFIDLALKSVFARCAVDPARVVVEGFSDGASYALGLALANGDLFKRVVAFSLGFIPPSDSPPVAQPEFFISHGTRDPILPIDLTSREIVVGLRNQGYAVSFVEFDGVHEVPAAVALQAVLWLLR